MTGKLWKKQMDPQYLWVFENMGQKYLFSLVYILIPVPLHQSSIASICLVLKGFDNKLSKINASSSSSIMLSWKNGINHSKKLLNWTCEIDLIFTWLIVPIQQKCLNPFNFSRDAAACGPSTMIRGSCIYLTTRLQKMLQETLLHLFLASSASASEALITVFPRPCLQH